MGLNTSNFKRECGLKLGQAWYLITNMLIKTQEHLALPTDPPFPPIPLLVKFSGRYMWRRMTSEVFCLWWREQRWFLKWWFTCYWIIWSGCWPKKVLLMYIFECQHIRNYVHLWGCHIQKSYSSSGIDIWTDTCKAGHVNRLVKTMFVIVMGREWRKFIK
jgi:hypothetical protein